MGSKKKNEGDLVPPSLNYVQRRESNPRDALLQLYLTERNRAAVIKLNINNGNTNFLIDFLAATATFFFCYQPALVPSSAMAPLVATTVALIEGATFHITIHCEVAGLCNIGLIWIPVLKLFF